MGYKLSGIKWVKDSSLISFSLEKSVVKDGESHHRSRRTTVLMDMVKAARKTGNREGTF